MKIQFNRTPLKYSALTIEQPSMDEVKGTPGLFNASLEDALLYGGDLTREALGAMHLIGDKKHIIVDTKIHMLMPGMYPAIPGWHTDGAPRATVEGSKGAPDLQAQEMADAPRFHLLVTGEGCLTDFVNKPLTLEVPDTPSPKLYESLTDQINALRVGPEQKWITRIPTCTPVTWDWWDLHTAIPAEKHEWRFLIRVTETNYRPPKTDLRDVLRSQHQVYVPESFGW